MSFNRSSFTYFALRNLVLNLNTFTILIRLYSNPRKFKGFWVICTCSVTTTVFCLLGLTFKQGLSKLKMGTGLRNESFWSFPFIGEFTPLFELVVNGKIWNLLFLSFSGNFSKSSIEPLLESSFFLKKKKNWQNCYKKKSSTSFIIDLGNFDDSSEGFISKISPSMGWSIRVKRGCSC